MKLSKWTYVGPVVLHQDNASCSLNGAYFKIYLKLFSLSPGTRIYHSFLKIRVFGIIHEISGMPEAQLLSSGTPKQGFSNRGLSTMILA